MFEFLNKYQDKGKFLYRYDQNFEDICNAPYDKSGVFYITTLEQKREDEKILYIGCSGQLDKSTNEIKLRKKIGTGLKGRLVHGHYFGKVQGHIAWPNKMLKSGLDYIRVRWYNTEDDIPNDIKSLMLAECEQLGKSPSWPEED
ncbi:MAG: hypothetical protein E7070_05500 [Bacteroidales bacterium]|jgi:hypothetical protein|nr:hypothetical protein [Bacteroidales bacterium]